MVAELDGVVHGFGTLNPKTKELDGIYVDPGFNRRGIGKELVHTLLERARSHNLDFLWLNASLNSVEFYEACGFTPKEKTVHTLRNGVQIPCVRMTMNFKTNYPTTHPPNCSERGFRNR